MKKRLLSAGLAGAFGLWLLGSVAASGREGRRPDSAEKAIRRVLDDQVAAWNRGDLPGFMEGYWKSEKLSFFAGGARTRGWQATLDRYRKKYQGEGREMGKLAFKDLDVELLGAESALVKGAWHLTLKKEAAGGLFTLVFRKLPEGWRIVHDHTSS